MATYRITFHGVAWVEAETAEEARILFYDGDEDAEYEIDEVEEA